MFFTSLFSKPLPSSYYSFLSVVLVALFLFVLVMIPERSKSDVDTYLSSTATERVYAPTVPEVLVDTPSTEFLNRYKFVIKGMSCTRPAGNPLSIDCQVTFLGGISRKGVTVHKVLATLSNFPEQFRFSQNESCFQKQCQNTIDVRTSLSASELPLSEAYVRLMSTVDVIADKAYTIAVIKLMYN